MARRCPRKAVRTLLITESANLSAPREHLRGLCHGSVVYYWPVLAMIVVIEAKVIPPGTVGH
jgi:hypothetical protein